jgi:hypothetical protein
LLYSKCSDATEIVQTLRLPSFETDLEGEASSFLPENSRSLPELPYLKILSVGSFLSGATRNIPDDLARCLLNFIFAHPSVEELQWVYRRIPSRTFPIIPHLRNFHLSNPEFIMRYLSGRPPGSVRLQWVDRVHPPSRHQQSEPLLALDPSVLQHVGLWSLNRLSQLSEIARLFPDLESLSLPYYCVPLRKALEQSRTLPQTVSRLLTQRGTDRRTVSNSPYLSIHDAMPFFRNIRAIVCVDTGSR